MKIQTTHESNVYACHRILFSRSKFDKTRSAERGLSTSINGTSLAQQHCTGITKNRQLGTICDMN